MITNMIRHLSKCLWTLIIPILLTTASCKEDINEDNLYTFTGETIEDFLTKRDETFSDFNYIVERAGLSKLMSAYGMYTCFAPTNAAVEEYIDSLYDDTTNTDNPHNGMTSRGMEGLTDSLCQDIAKYHISNTKYFTIDMNTGTTIATMLGRDLTTSVDSAGNTCINTYSNIISLDNEVENGVIQVINHVLKRSNKQMAGEMAQHPEFSIFYEALEKTGLADSLSKTKKAYLNKVSTNPTNYYVPTECKIGYTIFAETNETLKKNNIQNFSDLVNYADSVYGGAADSKTGWYDYFRNSGRTVSTGNDYTSRENALNMFIAYHLLKMSVPVSNFVYDRNQISSVILYEYYETMLPYTLFKITRNTGDFYINRYITNSTLTNQVALQGNNHVLMRKGTEIEKRDIQTINGYIHPIDGMLVYDETVPKGVLNERMRFDDVSFQPEVTTNRFRGLSDQEVIALKGLPSTDGKEWILFPSNYFDNMVVYNGENTKVRYAPGIEKNWSDYQEDEFLCIGAYDFAFRLPPVPDGTYELRIGYTAEAERGMVQFYLGRSNKQTSMKAIDIPLDMRINGTDPNIGWGKDWLDTWDKYEDKGIARDRELRNRGYMRGPLYFTLGVGGTKPVRSHFKTLRRIIVKQQFSQGDYWLRFKTVLPDNATTQFNLDYVEFCPANVYNNNTYVEDMY